MAGVLQISAGEPLLLSYGNLNNDFLFMDYGFIIPNNPHDRVALRFDVGLVQVSNITHQHPHHDQSVKATAGLACSCWV